MVGGYTGTQFIMTYETVQMSCLLLCIHDTSHGQENYTENNCLKWDPIGQVAGTCEGRVKSSFFFFFFKRYKEHRSFCLGEISHKVGFAAWLTNVCSCVLHPK